MSEELKKYNLQKLVVKDWSNITVQDFINIKNDKLIKKKLLKMKKNYVKMHSKENFINKFLKIIDK